MSYCRLAEDSDLYIFDVVHADGSGIRCQWCRLGAGGNVTLPDVDTMLMHVARHRAAGHRVPDWLETALTKGDG